MKILVVGGGGREHVLCWTLARAAAEVFCAPGNAGTADVATNLPISVSDSDAILAAVRQHGIDLTIVGPEAPLAAGLADRLTAAGTPVFGPSAAAARIESSKAFAKDLMFGAGIPTSASETFDDAGKAAAYIASHAEPLVVKASGLAAGKGAVVCQTREEALAAAREMFGGKFGDAGSLVVVEDFLEGEELSVLALTDGERVLMLPASQDHKRIGEGDTGPNTGGMGAYAPVSIATAGLMQRVEREVLLPALRAMAELGMPYRGVLYAGLMISPAGVPNVVEFNCRFGDPEAQVVLPIADVDLLEAMATVAAGESLHPSASVVPATRAAVTTVLAASGYPEGPRKGDAIMLPRTLPDETLLLHAGTRKDADGRLKTAGGRVLCATGFGPDVAAAAEASRRLAEAVVFDGKQFRRDIAWREVARAGTA